MDKKLLLNFIDSLDIAHVRYDNQTHYFCSFKNFNTHLYIKSVGSDIDFNFSNTDKKTSTNVVMDFETAKPILEKIFNIFQQSQLDIDLTSPSQFKKQDFQKAIVFVNNYLMVTDLTKDFRRYPLTLTKKIKDEEFTYTLKFSHLKQEIHKVHNQTSLLSFKLILEKNSYTFQIDHHFPGWKIPECRAFNAHFKLNTQANTIEEFSEILKLMEQDLGKKFLSEQLNFLLPQKKMSKQPKI